MDYAAKHLPGSIWLAITFALALPAANGAATLQETRTAYEAKATELNLAFADRIRNLDGGYRHVLSNLQKKFQEKGDLDNTLAVKAELDRFNAAPADGAGKGSPLKELADLQTKYTQAKKKFQIEHIGKIAALRKGHIAALSKFQAEFTRQSKFEEAIAVRDEIATLQGTQLKPKPSPTPKVTQPSTTPPARPPRTPPFGGPRGFGGGLPRDYTLYYTFDKAPVEGQVVDKSTNGHNGTVSKDAWIENGKRGGAFDFTDRATIELAHAPALQPESFTIAAWVNAKKPSSFGRIWDKYEPFKRSGYGFHLDQYRPVFELHDEAKKKHSLRTDAALSVGEWNHVAVSFSPDLIAIYINGKPAAKTTHDGKILGNESPVRIGLDEFRRLNGYMDELLFYPRALSEAEIRRIHAATGR